MKTITYDELMKMTKGGEPKEALSSDVEAQTETLLSKQSGPKTISYKELMALRNAPADPDEDTPYSIDTGATLKKADLKAGRNADDIRAAMVLRFGAQYEDGMGIDNDKLVEDFVDHMRYFNSNILSTAGEARFVSGLDDDKKAVMARSYELYDAMGNVFTNDGFAGAIDGVKDYIYSAATDPTNYIGILTGGMGKAAGVGLTQGGKQAVKRMAAEAMKDAAKSSATRIAATESAEAVSKKALESFAINNITGNAAKELAKKAAREEYAAFVREAGRTAYMGVLKDQAKKDAGKILLTTTALDSTFAMMQDYTLQNTLIEAGAQEQYSKLQTGFSSVLGGIGGLAQYSFGKFAGASGLGDAQTQLRVGAMRTQSREELAAATAELAEKGARASLTMNEKQAKEATDYIKNVSDSWRKKVERGMDQFDAVPTSVQFIKEVMIGADGRGGLAKMFKDAGKPLPKGTTVSDVMTSIVKYMPQEELSAINAQLKPMGITLGETTQTAQSLGDLLAVEISKGGQVLNVMSQVRKTIDAALLHGHQVVEGQVEAIEFADELAKNLKTPKYAGYIQNTWRRMLVSSPATTSINVMGFGQFYIGQSMADLFSMTGHTMYAMGVGGPMTAKGREALRVANVYKSIQVQKMRNLLDPHTTHDAYMAFLREHKDVEKILFESFSGGVERSAKRYGIDANAKWYKRVEATADGAARLTGVKIQDTFTKSQMFMTELDKHLRLAQKGTLEDILKAGNLEAIDNNIIGDALDTTLKSVFAKDYTTDDQLLAPAAALIERFSQVPGLGTVLPFGRFMNNTVATAYQWSIGGGVQFASAMYNKTVKGVPIPKTASEAFARSLVGVSALRLAMEYDEERRDKNLAWHHIDAGGGAIVDAKNMFPFSLWLALGRAGNLARQGEMVPKEMIVDVAAQLAVGQAATDLQFGNDIYNVFDVLLNQEEGARQASFDALYKQGGSFLAGFTRPLDAINRMVGLINNTDAGRDARQQVGLGRGVHEASRYVDNIIEIFTDRLESVTGEELRMATREGSIKDPNPVMSLLGVKVLPSRTSTEIAYSMAEMPEFKANERSQIPAYDKVFNEAIAPYFNSEYNRLIKAPAFQNASVAERRKMLADWKSTIVQAMRNHVQTGMTQEIGIDALRRKATMKGSKETRKMAKDFLEQKYGVTGDVKSYTHEELMMYLQLLDAYQ
jgi:hypothetical protein